MFKQSVSKSKSQAGPWGVLNISSACNHDEKHDKAKTALVK